MIDQPAQNQNMDNGGAGKLKQYNSTFKSTTVRKLGIYFPGIYFAFAKEGALMSPDTNSEHGKALTCCELTMSVSRRTRTAWRMAEGDFRVHGPRRWEPLGPVGPHPGTMAIFLPYNFLFLLLGSSHILSPPLLSRTQFFWAHN